MNDSEKINPKETTEARQVIDKLSQALMLIDENLAAELTDEDLQELGEVAEKLASIISAHAEEEAEAKVVDAPETTASEETESSATTVAELVREKIADYRGPNIDRLSKESSPLKDEMLKMSNEGESIDAIVTHFLKINGVGEEDPFYEWGSLTAGGDEIPDQVMDQIKEAVLEKANVYINHGSIILRDGAKIIVSAKINGEEKSDVEITYVAGAIPIDEARDIITPMIEKLIVENSQEK